jgi:hypothetical protein
MPSTEMCLLYLTKLLGIREVRGAALIYIHVFGAQGTVGSLPCSGAERLIFTLSARGFNPATFQLKFNIHILPAM